MPSDTPRGGRRTSRRGNGEGTIARRADGRYAGAYFVTRPDGTHGRKWVYGPTRADVAARLAEIAQQAQDGRPIPTRSPTLSEYLDYWMHEVVEPKLRPTTLAKYRSTVELYLRPGLGTQRLAKLTVAKVQQFLNSRRASGASVSTLRMIREVLSSALGRAVREELVARNVAQLTTLPAEHRRRRTAWTVEQARRFLLASADDAAHPVFTLAVVYGLRRGEIAGLRWRDVDFDAARITVQSNLVRVAGQLVLGPPKSRAGVRMLPIVPLVEAALRRQLTRQREQRTAAGGNWLETDHVFTTRTGRPVEPRNLSRSFDRIVAGAGLPPIVFHDLRRTVATLLKELGVSPRDAQVILGHSNVGVTLGIYSEVFDSSVADALDRIDGELRGRREDPEDDRRANARCRRAP